MNSLPQNPRLHLLVTRTGGFTLAEVLIVSALVSFILAAILSTFIFLSKGFVSISHYNSHHKSAALVMGVFSRDVREVSNVASFTPSYLRVVIPTNFTANGSVSGAKTITYSYTSGALYRTDSSIGKTIMLATNIHTFSFSLQDRFGTNNNNLASAKGIQLSMTLQQAMLGTLMTEDVRSARLHMRNIR